ncbi:MAG: hypothetical protein WCN95_17015, partial [bacterium]
MEHRDLHRFSGLLLCGDLQGRNAGCGSSREHAPVALGAAGI